MGKIGKAVDIDAIFRSKPALGQFLSQLRQALKRIGAAVCDHGLVALADEGQIPQLVRERAAAAPCRREQILGTDPGCLHLVDGREQLPRQLGAAACAAVDLQPCPDAGDGQRHAQQLSALVEIRQRRAAPGRQHAPREGREAEHLGIAGHAVAAAAAELALGLVAVLLGYQQQHSALFTSDQRADLLHHGRRLPGPAFPIISLNIVCLSLCALAVLSSRSSYRNRHSVAQLNCSNNIRSFSRAQR